MIQRIQTIWLLLAAACAFISLRLSFFSGNKLTDGQKLFTNLTGGETMLLTILTVAVGIAALILIFLYKDRKTQFRLTVVTMLVSLLNIYLYFHAMQNYVEGSLDITSAIVFIVPVLLFLAARGIFKDERLVRRADRLR